MSGNAGNFKPLNFGLEGRISMRPSRELDNSAAGSKQNAFPIQGFANIYEYLFAHLPTTRYSQRL